MGVEALGVSGGRPVIPATGVPTDDTVVRSLRAAVDGRRHDALIGTCAVEHGLELATRDRRALETNRALDAHVALLA